MGTVRPFPREKLVVPIIVRRDILESGSDFAFEHCVADLECLFGPIDYRSRILAFSYTDYYKAEMGPALSRLFLAFAELVNPSRLADIKLAANDLESRYAGAVGKRPINLDPGLLSLGRFVLATTKNRCQRVPLRDGIFAEVTLLYERGAWRPLPWTYPDYATPEYASILSEIRDFSKERLKREGV